MPIVDAELRDASPDRIRPNPDNPRLIFREADMNQLLESIREVGIQVPLTMYADGDHWVLIDGERRWRCAVRLNLRTVPAIIQPKPAPLENLLTMFNIHNVRTQWDLMPMALKMSDVKRLLFDSGKPNRPKELAAITGVPLSTVIRAFELLALPGKYQKLLLDEAAKPKEQQEVTADLFIEINKSARVVHDYAPKVFEDITDEQYLDALVEKYTAGVVRNVTTFRSISKIARTERTGGEVKEVVPILIDLIKRPDSRIEDAYAASVEIAYRSRDIATRAAALALKLTEVTNKGTLSREARDALTKLRSEINRLVD